MNDGHSGRYGSQEPPADGRDPHRSHAPHPGPEPGQDPSRGVYGQDPYHGEDPYHDRQPPPGSYADPYAQQPPRTDPYAQQAPYEPYAQQQQQPYHDPYGSPYGSHNAHDPYAHTRQAPPEPRRPASGEQWGVPEQPYDPYAHMRQQEHTQWQAQAQAPGYGQRQEYAPGPPGPQEPAPAGPQEPRHASPGGDAPDGRVPGDRAPDGSADGRSPQDRAPDDGPAGEFSFLEDPEGGSEDVIDWLRFVETRSERRDERRRKGRNRVVALAAALALLLTGVAGYLWYAGGLPGLGASGEEEGRAASGPQKRDVLVVHLRDTEGGGSSSALLVHNRTTGKGATVLLPNALAVPVEDGSSTTLGRSVEDGTGPTRDALGTLLGADIKGSWRLDTPYLEILVETVGGVTLDADTTVPAAKRGESPLVTEGRNRTLGGQAAVAYATRLAPGESQTAQLARFGQVMRAALEKISGDAEGATATVRNLNQIPDPSLTEEELGASLAQLAEQAKEGSYTTTLLPVRPDGTLGERATEGVVKKVLGGTAKTGAGALPRIGVRNATGDADAASAARAALVNGGYVVIDAGAAQARAASRVTYADPARAAEAEEVAKTLGLPADAVGRSESAGGADVAVVLGADYDTR